MRGTEEGVRRLLGTLGGGGVDGRQMCGVRGAREEGVGGAGEETKVPICA